MGNYSQEEVKKALILVNSLIARCQKAQLKFREGTSQFSLLKNRIKALEISKCLLENNDAIEMYTNEEIIQALAPIKSIIHKTTKAQSKYAPGSTQYKRFAPTIVTMEICQYYLESNLK